ncbi:WSC domain-containing protein 2 [Penicillium rolfsii]|nr:WSC domain-containing protein 2 [Penicillium rolfsii]
MHFKATSILLTGLGATAFAKDSRTFAVNHFYGQGPLTMGRMDPIVSPGVPAGHVHAIQGGSNFNLTMGDDDLLSSRCTSSLVDADKSNYWTPSLYFQDPKNGSFISVPMFYMNVYYFFEATDDEIEPFPVGLRVLSGDPTLRTPPPGGAANVLDTNGGTIQPIQWTCPRKSYDPPSYPPDSDGLHGVGIQDPNNAGAGAGFPHMNCDGFASPLRADIHFPSCRNPKVSLSDYKNNMVFPSSKGTTGGKQNCPPGWVHHPHIFYEVYWNTPLFADMWEQGKGTQPFVLSQGDRTGYGLHGDFFSGWDVDVLKKIIDNCDAGDLGMDKCADAGRINDASTTCNIPNQVPEQIFGVLDKLPGNNPATGWGQGGNVPSSPSSAGSTSTATMAPPASQTSSTIAAQVSAKNHAAGGESTSTATTAPPASQASSTTAAQTSASDDAISGWKYLGCYSDNRSTRVLTGIQFANLGVGKVTSTGCMEYCGNAGFSLAGTEYAGQCFCGDKLEGSSEIAASECHMKCEGDNSQTCGGSLALSVYEKNSETPSEGSYMHLRQHKRHRRSHRA